MSGFPYLSPDEFIRFPNPAKAAGDVVAFSGNLSPGMLISAYLQGIFPWYNEGEPILWQSPDPRFVLFPEKLHVSQSMRKILRQGVFDICFDTAFSQVIRNCAETTRKGQDGTWLTAEMINAYCEMHRLGYAHSAEAWQDGRLAGGCYGILLGPQGKRLSLNGDSGGVFFGESMFAHKPNASKAAFLTLAQKLFAQNIAFIDCQVWTVHLASLGGESLSRNAYLQLLFTHLGKP
ncbi:MAG: leucyl/phenylalanyl-tRNA--protein transferase [Spirochaetaceae bacterium]|jgi:leucyl/phenylalanyl-tRNA--protein transferase|nr:leucyl/phenylalanyl-tRNA--protein transferase [Spirochaetaceae bacterium]